MSDNDFEHIAYSKDVIEFVTVANEYCAFIESHASMKRGDFVEKVQKIFPLLYLKASMLPEVEDDNVETPAKFLTEVDYSFLLQKINEKMARFDSYQEVFDADMQFSEGAVEASIAEDICDIYQDLKDFLMTYRIGTTEIMTDAIWECQKNFKEYWGQRLVNSLRAVHHVIYSEDDINEDEPEVFSSPGDELNPLKDESWVDKHFNNYSDDEI